MEETITEPDNGEVRSVFKVHANNPVFRRLAADPRLADIARYILNDDVYVHQSRLNYKPGFRGREFYWHSDFETWHMEDGMPAMRALSISLTLTENLACNGPLMLIPGSHREYVVCPGATPSEHYRQSLKKQQYGVPGDACLEDLVARHGIVLATGGPGSVVLFDCNTMHGSSSNITPYPRSNIFIVYNAASNRLRAPATGQPPRPEYIASREQIGLIPRRATALPGVRV
jgi:ectoine hydroxylase